MTDLNNAVACGVQNTVEVRDRNGIEFPIEDSSDSEGWKHYYYDPFDIIAFKVLGAKEGYTYG